MPAPPPIDLDHNATTRPWPEVAETVARHLRDSWGNPGSRHSAGRVARRVLEDSRETLARLLGAVPDEVVLTAGGTEAINLFLFGTASGPPGTIALTAGEHPAVVESCRHLVRRGWKLHTLPVDQAGRLDPSAFDALPWSDLRLVTVILAHNETGVVQDVARLSAMCRERRVPLHLDAVQAVGKIPVDFHALGATALSLGAHKFHGPRGIGALLLRQGTSLAPHLFGGHQESGRRPGTEPVALVAGMTRALELWHADRDARTARIRQMRDRFEHVLAESCPPTVVHGAAADRLPNTANVAFPGLDGDALLVALDLRGVLCSLGSTCASGSAEPAPALLAMRVPPAVAKGSVRFSLGADNTPEEIDTAARIVAETVRSLRSAVP
jgi:cysteine desulfurase